MSIILLSGCGLNKKIVDDVHIMTAIGYDYVGDNTFEGTAIVPIYETDKTLNQDTYTTKSVLSKNIAQRANLKSSEPLVNGKLVVVLYGKELAEKGIYNIIDTLVRDPSVGANIHLGIAEESAKNIIETKKSDIEDIGINISKLIEHNIESGNLPASNLHQFIDAFYEEGIDPILPILKKTKDKDINITGIGLFKNGKMVDSILPDHFFALHMLTKSFENGNYLVYLEKINEYASVQNVNAHTQVKITNMNGPAPTFNYKIKLNGMITEYSGDNLTPKILSQTKKDMEKQLKRDSRDILQKMKEHNIDPIGLGRRVKKENRSWDEKKWYKQLNHINVNISVDIQINETGVAE